MNAAEKLLQEREAAAASQARKQLTQLLDEGSFEEFDALMSSNGHRAEVITGCGTVYGEPVYVFAQDSSVDDGAMGAAQAAKIAKVYDMAEKTGAPVIGIFDSKGAHVAEGLKALNAFSGLLYASNRLSGVVPQIAVINGVCAGSAAVLASVSDLIIMTEESQLFLTPPYNSEKGNDGSAQAAAANGTAHIIAKDIAQALECTRNILTMLPDNNLAPVMTAEAVLPAPKDCVCTTIVDGDSGVELFSEFGSEVKTGLARINGIACGIVGCHGDSALLDAAACAKMTRFVRLCDAFSIPVVTLVDAIGFAENDGSELKQAAMLSQAYSEATTAKIAIITKRAYGAAYVALCGKAANADVVFALPEATVSAMQPQAAVTVLMSERLSAGESRDALVEEYLATEASALNAAMQGCVDDVVTLDELRDKVTAALGVLSGKRVLTVARKHSNMPL